MSVEDQRVGRNVGRLRGRMSQADLAVMMRIRGHRWAQNTVSSVESGERPLRLTEAQDLVTLLVGKDASPSELLDSETSLEVRNALGDLSRAMTAFNESVERLGWARKRILDRLEKDTELDPIDRAAFLEALDRWPSRIELDFTK